MVEATRVDPIRQLLEQRRPRIAALHEAGNEHDRRHAAHHARPAAIGSAPLLPANRTYAPLQAFVDELVRCGVRHAVTCPGSRNAPLILALAEREEIECVSVIDERSAGFVALGMARATGSPVAITCTSGTAAANLHPAVAEAREASVPLLVLTADRPPELRDVGAGQSIDQLDLYGRAAKWFVEVGNHEPGRGTAVHHRALACRAVATAVGGRPGPGAPQLPAARAARARWTSRSTPPTGRGARTGGPGPSWTRPGGAPDAGDAGARGCAAPRAA